MMLSAICMGNGLVRVCAESMDGTRAARESGVSRNAEPRSRSVRIICTQGNYGNKGRVKRKRRYEYRSRTWDLGMNEEEKCRYM